MKPNKNLLQPQRAGLLAASPNQLLLILERSFLYTSPPKNKTPPASTAITIPTFRPLFSPPKEEEEEVVVVEVMED